MRDRGCYTTWFWIAGVWASLSSLAAAASPTAAELAQARRWVMAKFEGKSGTTGQEPGLIVLANHDPVQRNGRGGKPMKIVQAEYGRGLYCHAVSKVVVRLPGPGKTFSAVTGVDSNEQTSGGRGSVVFGVSVAGKEAYRGALMREGMGAVPVKVELGGATEFVLEVGDGGDGIGCDQADWADAKVELADGKSLWLGDLPVVHGPRGPYTTEPFFSFQYGGQASGELLKAWPCQREKRQLDAKRTQHVLAYRDPKTDLEIRCVGIEYAAFPSVEWTLYFKNSGKSDTPILADIQALSTRFERNAEGEFVLHHQTGSPCLASDYEPMNTLLRPGATKRISAAGGRPTNSDLPYFNVDWAGEGVIVVVGWPGQWAAQFVRDQGNGLVVRGGQELTHFVLHPGEEIRTPLIVLQFWSGDRLHAQNVWRSWMLAHNLPRPGGQLPPVQLAACSSHQFGEMIHANTANQKLFVDRYLEEQLKLDYWWMDAGWYWNKTGWPNTGTWEVDTNRFPGGLRSISDHAHAKGVKTIVWFEPERVTAGTWLTEKHPEWILGGPKGGLLNLGHAEARQWLIDHVDRLIVEQGIDLYRQDFNMDPLDLWRGNDAENRQGITEINHVTGYLAYWDELRRRHPNMLIDSCASGGRRNDLETLRRAVPLLRSDYIIEPVGNQCHTYGIAFWMPYYGTGTGAVDRYMLRSVMCPHFTACFDMRRHDLDFSLIREEFANWRKFAPYYFGDYYPLMPYSLDHGVWLAWQFDRPDLGEGMVQAFRRDASVYESVRLKLHGLDPDGRYRLRNVDVAGEQEASGQELMQRGLQITLTERPMAGVILYQRVK